MLRALFIGIFFFTMTPILISAQWLLGKLNLPGWGFIASNYYRVLCALLRIRVRVVGNPVRDRAVLFVSNHVSWVDIVVDRLDYAGRLCRQARSRELAAGRDHRKNAAHGFRRPRTPSPDRRRGERNRQPRGLAAHPSFFSPKAHRVTATASCRSAPRCSVRSRTKAAAEVF